MIPVADNPQSQPTPEARDALESARRARRSSEAAIPVAERLRDRVRAAIAANHFADLMEETLTEAARRRGGLAS